MTMDVAHMMPVTDPEPISMGYHSECGLILTNATPARHYTGSNAFYAAVAKRGHDSSYFGLDPSSMQETRLLRSIKHMRLCITSRYIRKSTPQATKPGKLTPNDRLSCTRCSSSILDC